MTADLWLSDKSAGDAPGTPRATATLDGGHGSRVLLPAYFAVRADRGAFLEREGTRLYQLPDEQKTYELADFYAVAKQGSAFTPASLNEAVAPLEHLSMGAVERYRAARAELEQLLGPDMATVRSRVAAEPQRLDRLDLARVRRQASPSDRLQEVLRQLENLDRPWWGAAASWLESPGPDSPSSHTKLLAAVAAATVLLAIQVGVTFGLVKTGHTSPAPNPSITPSPSPSPSPSPTPSIAAVRQANEKLAASLGKLPHGRSAALSAARQAAIATGGARAALSSVDASKRDQISRALTDESIYLKTVLATLAAPVSSASQALPGASAKLIASLEAADQDSDAITNATKPLSSWAQDRFTSALHTFVKRTDSLVAISATISTKAGDSVTTLRARSLPASRTQIKAQHDQFQQFNAQRRGLLTIARSLIPPTQDTLDARNALITDLRAALRADEAATSCLKAPDASPGSCAAKSETVDAATLAADAQFHKLYEQLRTTILAQPSS